MKDLKNRIAEIRAEKNHCSQTMIKLGLEVRNMDNPQLVRALSGLGGGMFSGETCGVLTGGCCLISTYFENNEDGDAEKPLVKEFVNWFREEYGSITCRELVGESPENKKTFCPKLIEEAFNKCMEIVEER